MLPAACAPVPRIAAVERSLPAVSSGDSTLQLSLAKWMDTLEVPGVSIAVIGEAVAYRGLGYTMIELAMVDRLGLPFDRIVEDAVFRPLRMRSRTFAQELPGHWERRIARGHFAAGNVLPGGWHLYPELAAAGLWTTPTDRAQLAIETAQSWMGRSQRVITLAVAQHHGWPETAQRRLSRAHARLLTEQMAGVGATRTRVSIDGALHAGYAGRYELAPGFHFVIAADTVRSRLIVRLGEQGRLPAYPASNTDFFFEAVDAQLSFVADSAGKSSALRLHQAGRTQDARRLAP